MQFPPINRPGRQSEQYPALLRAQLNDKAGAFLEQLQEYDRALDAYRKGHAYRAAVDLARREFPQQVVTLEEDWGDHLCHLKQVDMAISHYIEAGQSTKAIEAAISARQWTRVAVRWRRSGRC